MDISTSSGQIVRRAPGTKGKIGAALALGALVVGMFPSFVTAAPAQQANCQTFEQTGKQVCDRFLEYWNQNGGLAQQGLPLTDVIQEKSLTDGKTYTTQYFERSVFEMHPENAAPNDVLLSLLGVFQYTEKYAGHAANQTVSTATGAQKFSQTGHTVGGKFLDYWNQHGGLAQQGYPISDEFQEKSDLNGKTYTVQYFQRAVFDLHPENQAPYDVLLSQLGRFQLAARAELDAIAKGYPGGNGQATLTGAGSTFVNPIMSKWTQQYNTLYPGVKINYQSIGSGGGRQQFLAKTVDFGASDAPLSDAQFAQAGGADNALHIPIAMGGVVLAYNLPGVTTQLKLDGTTIANIYLLNITTWNDPAIAALNPGVSLPNSPIAVVHRSEGSGTTDIFTDYLSKVSPDWKSKVGRGTSVQWPGGIGAQGNEGVTNQVKLTQGGIGYIELGYAKSNNLPYALLKNQAGNFVDATASNVAQAADSLINSSIPADLRYSITNAPGDNSYPIAGTTWILAYANQTDANKGKIVAYFLWWASHDGQSFADGLSYAPLPRSIVQRVEAQIMKLNCGGAKCFP
jgi:phosphate transport system substrate-binding protein